MSEDFKIRLGEERDAETLADFNIAMARETEEKELPKDVVLSGVRGLMARPDHGFYLVAESEGAVAGSLMVTFEWSDWRDGFFWWVQSVYIRPEFRRRGVYRRLYQAVKDRAANANVRGFRLYVELENSVARKTYENLGMSEIPYKMYEEEVE